jgi:hypothetical protein
VAQDIDISFAQGADYTQTFTVKSYTGTVFNLTGYTVSAKMARSPDPACPSTVVTFSSATITDPTNGVITLTMTNNDTSYLQQGTWVYDVFIESTGGIKTKVIQGRIRVTQGLSH